MAFHPLTPGSRVGRYEVVAHLATGGMGEVYRARDVELERDVALKILPEHLSDNAVAVERFRREARAAARLSHKNIVTLFDWGQDGRTWFLAMEFVEGIDLHAHIAERGRLDPQEAWLITLQATRALDHAFEQGITHRDIKPSNFILTRSGSKVRVKLTDLGLARAVREDDYRVTRDGTTVGTIDYLAPEQARDSAQADIRSDIYSLGCTLYHMLAGHAPFPDGGLGERIYNHQFVEPADVRESNPDVPSGLWAVLRRMLAKQPEDRYQTPAELLAALRALSANAPAPHHAPPHPPAPSVPPPHRLPAPAPVPQRPPAPPPPTSVPESSSMEILGVSPEQRQAAAGQYEHANNLLAADNPDKAYAYQLLVSCCKLDPSNLDYRRTLRRVAQDLRDQAGLRRWLAPVAQLAIKARLKAARHGLYHRKVLEFGEEILAQSPDDTATALDMAEAAAALQLRQLQVWLLVQAAREDPENVEPLRRLAHAHEQHNELDKAIAVWEKVSKIAPNDIEAPRKIHNLSIKDTISRGKYGR
jgi:serine/threonine protein kinase